MKKCSKCLKYKENGEFWRDKYSDDGLCYQCKSCKTRSREQRRETYLNHKNEILRVNREYYKANKERINSQRKDYSKKYYSKTKGTDSRVYSVYKSSAKRKSIEFSLSFGEFSGLYGKKCHYCGSNSSGIDRVNNNCGYSISNCVSCCEICNKTKQTMSIDEWYRYICQLSLYNIYSTTRTIVREVKHKFSITAQYGNYRRSARRREKDFNLSFEQFKSFIEVPCNYCGSVTKNIVGLDRVDNNIGYNMDNCVSCCKICNVGKNSISIDIWANWIKTIIRFNDDLFGVTNA